MKKTFNFTAKNIFFAISCFIGLTSLSACSTKIQAKDDFSCKECCWNLQPKDSHKGWIAEIIYESGESIIHKVTTEDWTDSIDAKNQNLISKVILKDENGKEISTDNFKNNHPVGVHSSFRNS